MGEDATREKNSSSVIQRKAGTGAPIPADTLRPTDIELAPAEPKSPEVESQASDCGDLVPH